VKYPSINPYSLLFTEEKDQPRNREKDNESEKENSEEDQKDHPHFGNHNITPSLLFQSFH